MTSLNDIQASELNFNQYGADGTDRLIVWDGDRIPGLVSEVESKSGEFESGIERKLVSVRKSDIRVKPEADDEVRLSLDYLKVDDGEYWHVEKVRELELEYDVYFYRNVS